MHKTFNRGILTELALWRGEDKEDMEITDIKGYAFISTPSHGYLVIDSQSIGYSDACNIERASNYSFKSFDGLVYLEEDIDATEFLKLGLHAEKM